MSVVEAGYFRSPAFYLRLSLLALFVVAAFGMIGLRLWSLQVLQGRRYERAAEKQTVRTCELPTSRGPILDARGKLLAGTRGKLVVTDDEDGLGQVDENGVWRPKARGAAELRRLARLGGSTPRRLAHEIRQSIKLSPYSRATVLTGVRPSFASYLEERPIDSPISRSVRFPSAPTRSAPSEASSLDFSGRSARRSCRSRPFAVTAQARPSGSPVSSAPTTES
jgi:cell division protein FtsI/penicillin-binding protein 2